MMQWVKMMKNSNDAVDYFQLKNPLTRFKSKISHRARVKMFNRFMALANPKPTDLILDVGVTPDCSLPESNFFEKMYPYPANITMSSIEDASMLTDVFPGTSFVRTTPGEAFPFRDKQFDILFCSAVLEHVGTLEGQRFFLAECLRVAKSVYLTTPNRGFPVEFHTYLPLVHWLPQAMHQKILRLVGMDFWAKTENLNLLTKRSLMAIIPEDLRSKAIITNNRLLGLVSNLVLYISGD